MLSAMQSNTQPTAAKIKLRAKVLRVTIAHSFCHWSLLFARAPQGAAWLCARVLPVFDHLVAVYKNVFHASRVLMRFFEGCVVGDGRGIEHHDVGEHSFFQKSAMIEFEIGCG